MGRTSNQAKQRWNAAHYTQVKTHVKPEVASSFKAACAALGTSMASELGAFMEDFANPRKNASTLANAKTKTLGDRRKAMGAVIKLLNEIYDAEEAFIKNTPENLRGSSRSEMAEERLGMLSEALDAIDGIYDQ